MRKQRVITSDGIPKVLSTGGQIQYRPVKKESTWEWELWAANAGEHLVHVLSSKTGETRNFKSANALFTFHLRLFPESEGVFIPASAITTHARSINDETDDDAMEAQTPK